MEHEQVANAIHELSEFATQTAAVLQDHKQVLQRHEENLQAEFRCAQSHRDAITELRDLVAAQGQLLRSMQRVLLKITISLGIAPDEPPQSDRHRQRNVPQTVERLVRKLYPCSRSGAS